MKEIQTDHTVQKALEVVAEREGVSVAFIRREINIALAAAQQSNDPDMQAFWDSVPTKNDNPLTADDVIAFFAQMEIDKYV